MGDIRAMVVDLEGNTRVIDITGPFSEVFTEHTGAQWFEHVGLHSELDVWVDEEGRYNRPDEVNEYVTALRAAFIELPEDWPPLLGKALLTGGASPEGVTLSLSDELITSLEEWFDRLRKQAES